MTGILAINAASANDLDWKYADADYRLEASPAIDGEHLLRVDIPTELHDEISGVAAYVSGDTPVEANLIKNGDEIIAAEVFLPEKLYNDEDLAESLKPARETLPVTLYLLNSRESPQPIEPDKRRPVYFRGHKISALARPYTEKQLLGWNPIKDNKAIADTLTAFGTIPEHEEKEKQKALAPGRKPQHGIAFHWQACVGTEEDSNSPLELAVKKEDTAWFVFRNNRPAGSWRNKSANENNGEQDEADEFYRLPPPPDKKNNLQQIDLITIQRHGEKAPELVYKTNSGWESLPPEKLIPSLSPSSFRLRSYDDEEAPGFHLSAPYRLYTAQTETPLIAGRIEDATDVINGEKPETDKTIHYQDRTIRFGEYYLLPEPAVAELTLNGTEESSPNFQLPLNAGNKWAKPLLLDRVYLKLEKLPICLGQNKDLRLKVKVRNLPKAVQKDFDEKLAIHWAQLDDEGRQLASGTADVTNEENQPGCRMNMPMEMEVRRINLTLHIDGNRIPPDEIISVVPPTDSASDVQARGKTLKHGENHAVLYSSSQEEWQTATNSAQETAKKPDSNGPEQILVIDEYWGGDQGLKHRDSFDNLLSASMDTDIRVFHTGHSSTHTLAELEKFNALAQLDETAAETVIWAVGFDDLRADLKIDEIITRIHYFVQATLSRNRVPVLITIPPLKYTAPERLRQLALEIKEIGLQYGIPVVDLYLLGLLRTEEDLVNGITHTGDRSMVINRHVSNSGADRRWAARAIGMAVKQYDDLRLNDDTD
ncbi:MAG: SGNH/GDSL hydrolase family protein [Lentisphaeria bacterium]